MKTTTAIAALCAIMLASCSSNDNGATTLLGEIRTATEQGDHDKALSLIDSLRHTYPKDIEARREALGLFQQASLSKEQAELGRLDSLLTILDRAVEAASGLIETKKKSMTLKEAELMQFNLLKAKRDTIKAAYDTQCQKIRFIHRKMKEQATDND